MASRGMSGRAYVLTWIALLVLTGVSVGLSYVPLGDFGPVIALGIAAVKAVAVGLVFMHLLEAPFATLMVAIVNVLFVALLCLGIVTDVAFR